MEATQAITAAPTAPAIPSVKLDFAAVEATIESFHNTGKDLANFQYMWGVELAEAEINLKKVEANVGIGVRNSREKCTEGLVASMVDANDEVCEARKRVARLQARQNALRLDIENRHDTRRLFSGWQASQVGAGIAD